VLAQGRVVGDRQDVLAIRFQSLERFGRAGDGMIVEDECAVDVEQVRSVAGQDA
jgi:hypothetical protein